MRILYLSPASGLGGAERVLLECIHAVRERAPDWRVGVLALEDGPLLARVAQLGAEVITYPVSSSLARVGEVGRSAASTLLSFAAAAPALVSSLGPLRGRVRRWEPDIIHSNGIKTHLLGTWVAGRVPLVWHMHDFLASRRVSARALRLHSGRAAAVVATSNSVARDVATAVSAQRPITIYAGIDFDRFSSEGTAADLDRLAGLPPAPDGVLRIGLIGTYARWKGHATFLDAVARVAATRAVRAYVIGGPVYRTGTSSQISVADLTAQVRSLGLDGKVGIIGFLEDTAPAIRALDVIVHASTAPEPFGLTIAEGLACGRAVVMSEAGGASEIGDAERTCLSHPPGDVTALAHGMGRLADDPDLRQRLGTAGAEEMRRRFSRGRMAEQLVSLYERLARAS